MGREVACLALIDGQRVEGRALLETDAVVFRGERRLSIPLGEMSDVQAEQGRLTIAHPGGTAVFELGDQAEKWARSILHPPSRLDKLGVKEGHKVAVLGVDDDGFPGELEERVGRITVDRAVRDADVVFFGAADRDRLERLTSLKGYLKPDGALWVVRPKGGGPITESEVMAAGRRAGLVDVKVVRFSATHTAEKFVIPVAARRT
jgi:DUF3052 family protein